MSLQEPLWRVKTHPCPFYRQGNCIFSANCNFLHIENGWGPHETTLVAPELYPSQILSAKVTSGKDLDQVPTNASYDPTQVSELLHVLQDVMEDTSDDILRAVSNTQTGNPGGASDLVEPVTYGHGDIFSGPVTALPLTSNSADVYSELNVDDTVHPVHSLSLEETPSLMPFPRHSPDIPGFPHTELHLASTSDLLSPVSLPDLQLKTFFRDYHDSSIRDEHISDSWSTPMPLAMSPPVSPAPTSTFDLLSSPFRSPSSRIMSPNFAAFFHRVHPISPAPSNDRSDSDAPDLSLDALDSPVSDGPDMSGLNALAMQLSDVTSFPDSEDVFGSPIIQLEPSAVGCASPDQYDVDNSNEEQSGVIRSAHDRDISALLESPNHDVIDALSLTNGTEPPDDELNGDNVSDGSPTARLAYLDDPTVSANQDDTVTALYISYSDSDSSNRKIAGSTRSPAQTPSKESSSLITAVTSAPQRSHVFTPPPQDSRKRSSNAVRSLLSSPSTSLDSPSQYRAASRTLPTFDPHLPVRSLTSNGIPSSQQAAILRTPSTSATSPVFLSPVTSSSSRFEGGIAEEAKSPNRASSHEGESQVVSSTKIPLGFRRSFVLGGSRNSSLMMNRMSRVIPSKDLGTDSLREQSPKSPSTELDCSGLKPLRLSTILTVKSAYASPSRSTFISGNSHLTSTTVSPHSSFSNNILLSHPSHTLEHNHNLIPTPTSLLSAHDVTDYSTPVPKSAPLSRPDGWMNSPPNGRRSHFRVSSRLSEPPSSPQSFQEASVTEPRVHDTDDYTIRRPIPIGTPVPPPTRPLSCSITTPKPSLMFAIASDNVQQVRQVLERGEASPNDNAGPQSALAFAITNDQLSQRLEIVKTLLAFGADTSSLHKELGSPRTSDAKYPASALDQVDPATRYYISRTDAFLIRSSSTLMRRSSFRPLARIRFGIVGQDRALEQLFRVLSIHDNQKAPTPIVMLLCGPSGHGKSLLAQKFGPLLDVPTHTVNMTTLRSAYDLWQSYSMSSYQDGSPCTLIEFLINNEGKRCVVVLDEIEKTQDPSVLWSLLLPWELGRCSFEANTMNIDVHNTVWLGTSNIGQDLVFEYHGSLKHPDKVMSREEYVKLMSLMRPRVSERLGSSILSRVTTILPFVPFTLDETRAIASEALQSISGDVIKDMSSEILTSVVEGAILGSIPSEGARSLYRAVSNLLVDAMDLV